MSGYSEETAERLLLLRQRFERVEPLVLLRREEFVLAGSGCHVCAALGPLSV